MLGEQQEKRDLKSMSLEELETLAESVGEKKFRAKQLFGWLHKNLADTPEEMSNLPGRFLERILTDHDITSLHPLEILTSKIDGTQKYLFALPDGNVIESVLMKYHHGNSVCISSQAGCRMGCAFCASTIGGLERNLLPGEMLDQIYKIRKITGERVSNVVVMGTGEPLDNMENLLRFVELLTDANGQGLSQRNITVSTCGLVPKIKELASCHLSLTLALSLHAADDEKRKKLMPVARKYSIKETLEACDEYFLQTGRRITYEYSLIQGENDTREDAKKLSALLKGKNAHVNLIPVNPVKERDFLQSKQKSISDFKIILEKNGINVTIRREMGRDIQGACGQLRRSYREKLENP